VSGPHYAFVLRLWMEAGEGQPLLRGSLELVEPSRTFYFDSLDQIPHLLRHVLDPSNAPFPPHDRKEADM
jgi:hypothetical protein